MIADNRPKALVMGLGNSGFSSARYLVANQYDVEVIDTRDQPPMLNQLQSEFPDVSFVSGSPELEYLCGFDIVVASPGLSVREGNIARFIESGEQVIGDVELFSQQAKAPIIAITGANGKSTVTELIGHILKTSLNVQIGGNIGIPVLDLLDQPVPDVYVLELSSFQLETTHSLNAKAAVVLNISEDHMDRYRDIDDYADIKQRIYTGDGVVVLNRDDSRVMAMQSANRVTRYFTTDAPQTDGDYGISAHEGIPYLCKGDTPLLPVSDIKIAGRHNVSNVLAALALIEDFDLPLTSVQKAIQSYAGLPHRCQIIANENDVLWINDSKATNVGATVAALDGMDRPVVLIAGGEGKGADFNSLAPAIEKSARAVILIGRDANLIQAALGDFDQVFFASDMEEAVNKAEKIAQSGDAVLLSPACASFDMFENFEHRGRVFTELAKSAAVNAGRSLE